jgi:Flp pilus assembly pilin Flp
MYDYVKVLVTLWTQRWQALREDEGATAVEYAVIVAIGFAMATLIGVAIKTVVTSRTKGVE